MRTLIWGEAAPSKEGARAHDRNRDTLRVKKQILRTTERFFLDSLFQRYVVVEDVVKTSNSLLMWSVGQISELYISAR
jgi:hypothetical protein